MLPSPRPRLGDPPETLAPTVATADALDARATFVACFRPRPGSSAALQPAGGAARTLAGPGLGVPHPEAWVAPGEGCATSESPRGRISAGVRSRRPRPSGFGRIGHQAAARSHI